MATEYSVALLLRRSAELENPEKPADGRYRLPPEESVRYTGFQYADWEFDGDDLIYLVRMSYRGARNYHDSNRITFHRERNFRRAASPDSGAK